LVDDDKTLAREVRTYIQTDKYVGRKNDGTASHTTQRILRERYEENRERRQRLVRQLEQLCKEAACHAAGQPLETKAATAATAVADGLNYLVRNTFNKLGYLTHLSANPQAEIKAVLSATDVDDLGFSLEAGQGNLQAINEVVQHIELAASANRQIVLEDLVQERFGRRPYGWPEWEVVLLVARLVRRGDISLVMDGGVLALDKAFEAITSPSKWRRITVVKRKTVDSGKLQEARNLAKDVLGRIAPDGEDALDAHLREQLGRWRSDLSQYKTLADTGKLPRRRAHRRCPRRHQQAAGRDRERRTHRQVPGSDGPTCWTSPTMSTSCATSSSTNARPGTSCARPRPASSPTGAGSTRTISRPKR
jgi:hypothetical protein